MRKRLFWAVFGALLAYFYDPQNGTRRRNTTRDRLLAFGRRSAQRTQAVSQTAYAAKQKVTHLHEEPKPQPDDVTLARKVETEIFRDPEVPKGQINVNAVDGVVELRGEVKRPEMVNALEEQARKVQGVRDVNNLLHTPGTPAPTAPERSSSRG
jgi:osmotically-inducible protein OsmY